MKSSDPITHVEVCGLLGRRELVPLETYLAAPESYLEATHARLVPRSAVRRGVIARLMARRRVS